MLRHLAIFEKAFRRHGAGVLEKLPTSFLYRVSLQLESIAADEALRRLATVIDQTLARRTQNAERELALVSSLEFANQVEVEEFIGDDALREFSMLWKSQSTGPAVAANASRLHPAQDDWPYTQPQRENDLPSHWRRWLVTLLMVLTTALTNCCRCWPVPRFRGRRPCPALHRAMDNGHVHRPTPSPAPLRPRRRSRA
jgi:hypothetical protein